MIIDQRLEGAFADTIRAALNGSYAALLESSTMPPAAEIDKLAQDSAHSPELYLLLLIAFKFGDHDLLEATTSRIYTDDVASNTILVDLCDVFRFLLERKFDEAFNCFNAVASSYGYADCSLVTMLRWVAGKEPGETVGTTEADIINSAAYKASKFRIDAALA